VKPYDAFRAWGRILSGHRPMLSIEITRECPLRCPGCYAYEPDHLNGLGPLRSVADYRGDELVERVTELVRQHRPIHVSIVGGEPLVRYRELELLLPKLSDMGVEVQLVTSAVRPIPLSWRDIPGLHFTVSIDGLQPEHDVRRAPATYDRILKHIQGHRITPHCTITHQMVGRAGYFEEFLEFWSAREEVRKIWFSLFTPQVGEKAEEILSGPERHRVLAEIATLRPRFPKLELPDSVIKGYLNPPRTPEQCIFAQTTLNFTADLKSRITPCQFGGNPSCSECGCIASAGIQAVGDHKLLGIVPLRSIFTVSGQIGKMVSGRPD
jgi:sulfatase maturation enzyme AslB (radical SAM superfamily)